MLNIGQIEYANCTPLFQVLREHFSCSGYEFISGVPAELNRKLLDGAIDVCPSSSIEYAYHPECYSILPHLSISSIGAVGSVLLFSRVPIEDLNGWKILLSSESATSVNLLKILLQQRYDCVCRYEVAPPSTALPCGDSPALLLIGDAALMASIKNSDLFVYDLGELWHSWTGYPFVFALWLCRNEIADRIELKELSRRLVQAKILVPQHLEQIVLCTKEVHWMGIDRLLSYWRDNISYHLDKQAQVGLMFYYEKCFECGLINSVPPLRFTT
ncbi:MAG: menaquinone biosynthesis protein [Desulfuromonadaceae bacterium]|nr:menaquinone biosynthesis protein [Desulfuromonadaceae bacterium]MDD5107101.1 menaquinone biosynthesis protein [Desulfuromonadaceae bacterium]